MNATPVVLAGESVASMVRAAERACGTPDLLLAIVGGFAVTCRLGRVHRATGDVDMVADELATVGAEPTRVMVAGTSIDVTLPIATPAALVATKLHAFCDRPRDEKRASDAYDIFRLVEAHDADGSVAAAINDGPRGLAEAVHELAADKLVENAERVVRYLKVYGEPVWDEISSDDIRRVLGSLVARLRN